jgi:hypothetical protein
MRSSSPSSPVVAWIETIRVPTMHPGSRRSRPVAFWAAQASAFFGRAITEAQFRAAALEAGVRLGPDGASTDLAAGESLFLALRRFPARYELTPEGRVQIRAGSKAPAGGAS